MQLLAKFKKNLYIGFRATLNFRNLRWLWTPRSTKTIKYWIKNISRNIGTVIFKLGTSNVHQKRNKMAPTILLPWQHSWLQSLSVKNQMSPFATFLSGTGGLPQNRHAMYISGGKFEDHCFNISGDILNWVFYHFSGTIYDVITSLVCIIQKPEYL